MNDMPRVAMQVSIPDTMIFFSADGHFENYGDRRLAVHDGIFGGRVEE